MFDREGFVTHVRYARSECYIVREKWIQYTIARSDQSPIRANQICTHLETYTL